MPESKPNSKDREILETFYSHMSRGVFSGDQEEMAFYRKWAQDHLDLIERDALGNSSAAKAVLHNLGILDAFLGKTNK